nr:chlorophyll synthase, chloroplastic isoform X2 [Arachis hypogaea]
MASLLKIVSVSPRTSLSSSSSTTSVHSRPPLAPFFPLPFTRSRIAIRAAGNQVDEPNQQTKTGSSFNQLLGIKGAAQETTMNDWYDREIDAINEPYRPIPSGAISENEVIAQIWFLLLGGLTLAGILDIWAGHTFPTIFDLALGGSLVSYIYSAPPFKLKRNGWIGNLALGASYISLPWLAGQALFGTLSADIIFLTLLYSIAGFGVGIVNDFKSVEGDRAHGLQSIPVAFGAETAKWISVGAIDITQLLIVGYLLGAGKPYHALALLVLTVPQVIFQFQYFLKDPEKYDVKYQASAQPFLVLGMLVTALASCH